MRPTESPSLGCGKVYACVETACLAANRVFYGNEFYGRIYEPQSITFIHNIQNSNTKRLKLYITDLSMQN